LRDAFSVLFFVSVGMLFEPSVIVERPWHVLGTVAIIIFGKSFAAWTLVLALRYPLNTAGIVAASLAQIGEFSFILAGLGLTLGLLPAEGMSLLLAGALISIALNPLVFFTVEPARRWMVAHIELARRLDSRADPYATLPTSTEVQYLEGQVVLVGYGRVGRRIAAVLDERGIPYVVAEENREVVESLRERGIPAVSGNAAEASVLIQAHIARAAILVVATPDPVHARKMVETARQLNPQVEVVLRTHTEDDSKMLEGDGLGTVFFGEAELAKGMARHVTERYAPRSGEDRPVTPP
jgi:CPA2 family monovalent cation:H+ antiporter-2